MRKAHLGKPGLVYDAERDNLLLGASLGYDYCAEHEWGIESLLTRFGVTQEEDDLSEGWGIPRRTITQVPESLIKVDLGDSGIAIVCQAYTGESAARMLPHRIELISEPLKMVEDKLRKDGKPRKVPLRSWVVGEWDAAWDEHEFAFRSTDRESMETIWQAFQDKDVILMRGGVHAGNPFGGSGIVIGIASRLSDAVKDGLYEHDKEFYEVRTFMEKSEIKRALEVAGKRWFQLAPSRMEQGLTVEGGRKVAGPGEIAFWLNPHDQKRYACGWYSLADLQAWARDEGPVVKTVSASEARP